MLWSACAVEPEQNMAWGTEMTIDTPEFRKLLLAYRLSQFGIATEIFEYVDAKIAEAVKAQMERDVEVVREVLRQPDTPLTYEAATAVQLAIRGSYD